MDSAANLVGAEGAAKLERKIACDDLAGSKILAELRALVAGEPLPGDVEIAELGEVEVSVHDGGHHDAELDAAQFVNAMTGDDLDVQSALLVSLEAFICHSRGRQATFAREHDLPGLELRPTLDAIAAHVQAASPAQQGAAGRVPLGLTLTVANSAAQIAEPNGSGRADPAIESAWHRCVGSLGSKPGLNVQALVQWVLREAYLETTETLAYMASRVKFYNAVKRALREELRRARHKLAAAAGNKPEQALPGGAYQASTVVSDFTGSTEVIIRAAGTKTTKAQLDAFIKEIEDRLSSIGEDAQLANVDMQSSLQRQQQTLSLLSSIGKTLHDTARAIISKIGS